MSGATETIFHKGKQYNIITIYFFLLNFYILLEIENDGKQFFVDVKKGLQGTFIKIRSNKKDKSIVIPFSAFAELNKTFMEINKLKINPEGVLAVEAPAPKEKKVKAVAVDKAPQVKKEKAPRVKKEHSLDKVADPTKVFVSGLSWESTSEQLNQYFSTVGGITSAEVLSTRKGRSMGSGIIEFANASSVSASIAKFNQKEWMGRALTVREYYQ